MPRRIKNKSNCFTTDQRNLLYYIASKVIRGSFQIDELVNVAWLRYCRYSEKNVCCRVMKFEMYRYMTSVESKRMATLDTEDTTIHPIYLEDESRDEVKDLLNSVGDKRKRVMAKLYYLKGFNLREVAKVFNITNQCVSSHLRSVKDEIKRKRARDYW